MFELNIYDDDGSLIRTAELQPQKLKFGVVRRLFKLLRVKDEIDTAGLFAALYDSWGDLLEILSDNFPSVAYDEWENIPIDEVARAVIEILKYSLLKLSNLQSNQKN